MTQETIGRMSDASLRPGIKLGQPYEGNDVAGIAGGVAPKIVTLTITAANSTAYTFSVQGRTQTHTITFTSDGTATTAEIQAGLIAAAQAQADLVERVLVYDSGADKVVIEGLDPGDDFSVSESDANLALAVTQAASDGEDIEFGSAVCSPASTGNQPVPLHKLPINNGGALTDPFVGVSLRAARDMDPATGQDKHWAGGPTLVRRRGLCTVEVEPGVNPAVGDTVYIRLVDAGTKLRGQFTSINDAGNVASTSKARWAEGPRGQWNGKTIATLYVDAL